MELPTSIIDPPSPFDDVAVWRDWLAELATADPAPDILAAIADAKRVIAEKENPT